MTARRIAWALLVLLLTAGIVVTAGLGLWQFIDKSRLGPGLIADNAAARQEVIDVTRTSVSKILSYPPDVGEDHIAAVTPLMTGKFLDFYQDFLRDTVIPQANSARITADTTVKFAGVDSLTADRANLLAFISQTTRTGGDAPTETSSTVSVGLAKVDGSWRIERFDPLA